MDPVVLKVLNEDVEKKKTRLKELLLEIVRCEERMASFIKEKDELDSKLQNLKVSIEGLGKSK